MALLARNVPIAKCVNRGLLVWGLRLERGDLHRGWGGRAGQ